MSAESPRHARSSGGPLLVPSQPPSDRSIIDTVSGFINDVKLTSSSPDQKDTIQWARFETADINEPTPEGDSNDVSPLLLILGYGAGVQVWLIPPNGEAQEVLSWRQGTVRVLRILPTPQYGDSFASKRPLLSLCDSASPGPPFCSLSFISIRGGEQVKSIKFKNPILDVLANKRSVVVSFSERFAVFDAGTLEDRLAVTTCYPCPCPLGGSAPVNPLALGDRWLAYADKKINPSKRSSGGCEGEGVASYTATVLHAAKSLGKGLRGLGESVAQSLAGGRGASPPHATPPPPQQPGAVTIIDIEGNNEDDSQDSEEPFDPIVAHFVAHSDAIIALQFDASGLLLVTADRRGHDFHVFRIHPHPCGSSLASVHHLYILHRGDTTAKVQDIAISPDSRWAAISTLRGTTHIFAMSPYGGWCGVRTHTSPRVVNRLSRFHRSAGLPIHAASRSGSPVGEGMAGGAWFPNPRLPPYPLPTTGAPLAQLRSTATIPTNTITRNSSGRQRLSSLSEDSNGVPLLARARFGQSVSCSTSGGGRGATSLSLYLLPASGALTHLLLHPRPARSVPKEKICDDSPIEVDVEPASQWPLQRPPTAGDLLAPLPASSPLLQSVSFRRCHDMNEGEEERWLSQVEIVTHAGPHRRLWMGPQFVFKTYNCTGSNSSLSEAETVEVETTAAHSIARSNPVNMPGVRPAVPLLIDSGSASSLEHSPSDSFRKKSLLAESGRAPSVCDVQLREELAEAMKEEQGWSSEARSQPVERRAGAVCIERAVDPLGTVVVPAPGPPPHLEDVDLYTHSNDDEARFRPVVRAPAPTFLPPHADVVVRPLPVGTTIPVQTVTPTTKLTPEDEPLPLNSDVVIPAALTYVQNMRDDCALPADIEGNETEPVKVGSLENKITDDKDLKSEEMNAEPCERKHESESTESVDVKSLPKSNQPVDIQPATRVKKSPTPKLISDKNDNVRIDKGTKYKERKETKCIYENKITAKIADVKVNIQVSANDNDRSKNLLDEIYTETKIKETKELKCSADDEGKKSQLSKISKKNKDIVKSYPKETVDDSSKHKPKEEVNVASQCRQIVEPPLVSHSENQDSSFDDETSTQSNVLPQPKELKINTKVGEEIILKEHETTQNKRINELKEPTIKTDDKISNQGKCEVLPSEDMDMSQSHTILQNADDVKTEDQAWDLLLTDTITSPTVVSKQPTVRDKTFEDIKVKPKKSKKNKKSQEEMAKADEDSFVEIHTIEDKLQENVGDLVALSTDFDDEDTSRTPLPKKKSRSSKSATPESKLEVDTKIGAISFDNLHHEHVRTLSPARKTKTTKKEENDFDLIINPRTYCKSKELQKTSYDFVGRSEGTTSESTSYIEKEMTVPKSRKCKSLSPYPENIRKVSEKADNETAKKDIIVIDSTKDEFPEIQITTFNKTRKKSIQSTEIKEQIVEVVTEKPIKSWSSIAGGSGKKVTEEEKNNLKAESSNTSADVFLHDKLFEICKRTDIMVAQCDAPSELNFIEGHHSVIEDLPPLEPLDFALDGFKLDVMQDSLLDVTDTKVTSPICKINIDDILSSIKETTNKVIESSKFNLVELKQVSVKSEKGFNVVENENIVTQEIDIKNSGDEDSRSDEKVGGIMEKSSDDDNTSPVLSTDSDKDDKKQLSLSNAVSAKQATKSKKSRKKRK